MVSVTLLSFLEDESNARMYGDRVEGIEAVQ
jgi:hypothetical protein